ncbi:MAG TPA: serine/threonine-protein kinase [Candidatus Obscuribacterales bacterium]
MGGQILGDRYEVERQLGKKSGRWTLKARDLETSEWVILKVLFIDDSLNSTDLRLFKREVEALKLLNHDATPRYRSYFELALPTKDQALVLVQTYVEGVSLKALLEAAHPFTQADTMAIAQQTLSILDSLHHQTPPIIHRDVRPSNILLQPGLPAATAKIFLVDFGTVKSLNASSTSITMVGTDGYLPPEQSAGRVLAVSDLYSLGATLAECLTGLAPAQLQTRGFRIQFEDHATVTPAFAQWLKKLLSPSLDERWPSAREALTALTAIS